MSAGSICPAPLCGNPASLSCFASSTEIIRFPQSRRPSRRSVGGAGRRLRAAYAAETKRATDEQPPYVPAQPLANAGSSTVIFIAAEGLAQILLDVVKISVERKWVRPINRRIVIDGYQHVSTEVSSSWITAARLHQLQPLALRHAAQSVLAFLVFVYH